MKKMLFETINLFLFNYLIKLKNNLDLNIEIQKLIFKRYLKKLIHFKIYDRKDFYQLLKVQTRLFKC